MLANGILSLASCVHVSVRFWVCIRQTKMYNKRAKKKDWQRTKKRKKRFQLLCEYPVNTSLRCRYVEGNVPIKWHKTFIISFDSFVVNRWICLFIYNDNDFDFQFYSHRIKSGEWRFIGLFWSIFCALVSGSVFRVCVLKPTRFSTFSSPIFRSVIAFQRKNFSKSGFLLLDRDCKKPRKRLLSHEYEMELVSKKPRIISLRICVGGWVELSRVLTLIRKSKPKRKR